MILNIEILELKYAGIDRNIKLNAAKNDLKSICYYI